MNLADNAPGRRSRLPHPASASSTSAGVTQRPRTPSPTSSDSPIHECTTAHDHADARPHVRGHRSTTTFKQRHWPGTSKWNKIEHRLFSHITTNWRGRPLTSHEVIVASIAATTTRTGLAVHAEVDAGAYPTGVEVSDAQVAALPMTRHRFHGDWNYTLHADDASAVPTARDARRPHTAGSTPDRRLLSDPELTGMSRRHLAAITAALAQSQAAQREQHRNTRRGAPRRRAPGAGQKIKLADTDRVLATVLYLRKLCTQTVLAELFGVDRTIITKAVRDVSPLLHQHGHAATPSTARFPTPADLTAFLDNDAGHPSKIKPAS
jgi:Rhodopirellula transposase DDE domain/Helix-turn-helix of DDE superfamily endonuclease